MAEIKKIDESKIIEQLSGTEHLLGISANGTLCKYPKGKLIDSDDYIGKKHSFSYMSGKDGMFHSVFRVIGTSGANGASSVLLVAPISDLSTTIESLSGIFGRFYLTRGGDGALPSVAMPDVILYKAYNRASASFRDFGPIAVKPGYCTYNGQMYLAIKFPASYSNFTISFSGLHSGNCVFTPLPLSSVVWHEDF